MPVSSPNGRLFDGLNLTSTTIAQFYVGVDTSPNDKLQSTPVTSQISVKSFASGRQSLWLLDQLSIKPGVHFAFRSRVLLGSL